MKKMNIVKAMAALAIGALTLSACATSNNADSSGSNEGPVTISFWNSVSGPSADAVEKVVKDFNAANEGKIKVEATFQGLYDDAIAKLTNAVKTKNTPDLIQINDVNTVFMVDSKITLPIDDLNAATPLLKADSLLRF